MNNQICMWILIQGVNNRSKRQSNDPVIKCYCYYLTRGLILVLYDAI